MRLFMSDLVKYESGKLDITNKGINPKHWIESESQFKLLASLPDN